MSKTINNYIGAVEFVDDQNGQKQSFPKDQSRLGFDVYLYIEFQKWRLEVHDINEISAVNDLGNPVAVPATLSDLYDQLRTFFFRITSLQNPLVPDTQRVNTYNDLPTPAIDYDGQYWAVDTTIKTGVWPVRTVRSSGIYKSVGGVWEFKGADVPAFLVDDTLIIKDDVSGFGLGLILDSLSANRQVTLQDKNGIVSLKLEDFRDYEEQSSLADIEGRVGYVDKALSLKTDIPGSTQSLGQEFWTRVINKTGVTIQNGTPVHINGFDATSGRMTIEPSDLDDFTKINVVGFTTNSMLNDAEGFVTSKGFINDIDTSTFTEGQPIFLKSGGGFTSIELPTSVFLGYVTKVHATAGQIYITYERVNFSPISEMIINSPASTNVLNGSYVPIAGGTILFNSIGFINPSPGVLKYIGLRPVTERLTWDGLVTKNSGLTSANYNFALFHNGIIIPRTEETNLEITTSNNTEIQINTTIKLEFNDEVYIGVEGNGTDNDVTANGGRLIFG